MLVDKKNWLKYLKKDDKLIPVDTGDIITIPKECKHQIKNTGDINLIFVVFTLGVGHWGDGRIPGPNPFPPQQFFKTILQKMLQKH